MTGKCQNCQVERFDWWNNFDQLMNAMSRQKGQQLEVRRQDRLESGLGWLVHLAVFIFYRGPFEVLH
jgi:hypothetical protein